MRFKYFQIFAILCFFISNLCSKVNAEPADEFSIFYNNLSIKDKVEDFFFNKKYERNTSLCTLMTKCGSDKGSGWHNYTTLYSALFNDWTNENLNIFELGLGTNNPKLASTMGVNGKPGASLIGWSIYFPNSLIFGADIDKEILFAKDRINTFYCDQRDSICIKEMFDNSNLNGIKFDIILDDGLHEFTANKTFLENSFEHLKKGGVYIIEDLDNGRVNSFRRIITELKQELNVEYINVLNIPNSINKNDNAILIIQK